ITLKIREGFKKVLIISEHRHKSHEVLEPLRADRNIPTDFTRVYDLDSALQALAEKQFDCIVLDCEGPQPPGYKKLKQLREATGEKTSPVIVYITEDITPADEKQWKKYADAIIRKLEHARMRLMDALELFLFKLKEIGKPQSPVAAMP